MLKIGIPNKRVIDEPLTVSEVRLLVKQQAMRHTRRLRTNPLFDLQRPNEPDIIKAYRNANKRMLTKDGYDRWCSKVGRIIEGAGLQIDPETLNENTREYLEAEPFYYLGQYSGIQEYALRVIVPQCNEDPNAILVHLPYGQDKEIPPARPVSEGGVDPSQPVNIEHLLVNTEDVIFANNEYFDFLGFEHEVTRGNSKEIQRVIFRYTFDEIIIFWPYYNDEGKLDYRPELWYKTDFGFLAINYLPGRLTRAETGEYYNESYLHPYYEYADEFLSSFTDVQANRVQNLHAKVVMRELPCPETGCKSGKVTVRQKDGTVLTESCKTCKGSGLIKDPGPYGVLVEPVNIDKETSSKPVISYITPPTETFNIAWDRSFELLERGEKAIGLDLLINLNESGAAMENRLQDLEDMLKDFGGSLIDTIEVMLEAIDALLNFNPANRKAPKIIRPKRYDIKTALGHKAEYDAALPFDRYNSAIQLIQNKYRGDAVKQRVYQLAFKYAPVLLLSEQEFNTRLAAGNAGLEDLAKRDNAVILLMQMATEMGDIAFLNIDEQRILQQLESEIQPLIPQRQLPLFNDNGEPQ
jgi:hypothetical protein